MVQVELNLQIKCDRCKRTAYNHTELGYNDCLDIDYTIEKLAELNDMSVDGDSVLCLDCDG